MKAPKPSLIAAALIFALSVFGFTLFVWKSFGGTAPFEAQGYRFHARFGAEAVNLTSGSQVRISGVRVGKVVKAKEIGGQIDATIQLDSKYAPVPADAHAAVRTKTLLGETFIELTGGNRNGPKLAEGATLPLSQITNAQGLDQVLGSFDKPTREAFKQFLNGVAAALDGRGADLNAAVGAAGPGLEDLRKLVDILDRQDPALRSLVRDTGTALNAASARQADLQTVITAGNQVFGATAARNEALTQTVSALPGFLRTLRGALTEMEGAAGELAPTTHALREVAPLLPETLARTDDLSVQLTGMFRQLIPVLNAAKNGLPAARRVVNSSRPLVDVLNPTGSGLAPVLGLLLPVTDLLDKYKREAVTSFANVAASMQSSIRLPDGTDYHYLRVSPPLSNDSFAGATQAFGSNRSNPYPAPGYMDAFGRGEPLRAFDCSNAKNLTPIPPLGLGNPPCLTQAPWEYRGKTRAYPHVRGAVAGQIATP